MPTLDTLQLPRIDTSTYGGREAKKIAGHLYQVEEQLRYVLGHLDEDNLSDGLKSKIESGGMGSEVLQTLDAITLRISGQDDAVSELRVDLSGITATVQEQGGAISELRQTAEGITGTVQANRELSEEQAAAALEQALKYTDTQLENYPTSAEMSSAIEQRADSITTTVAAVYSTKEETTAKADAARDAANGYTDDALVPYSTTVEMRSSIEQRAESILSEVSARYGTKAELQSTVEQTAGSILSTVADGYASKTELLQTVNGLRLTVENGETSSRLTLTAGEAELSSGEITLDGVVTFHDLEVKGETVINGSNITTGEISADLIKTGVIQNHAATTVYDLDNGTIQMGATSGTRVRINKDTIRWYVGGDPTGVFNSVYGVSYIGANSANIYYGWLPRGSMDGQYYGMKITNGGTAHFKTTKVECNGSSDTGGGWLEADTVKCNNLNVTNGKGRIVDTQDYGIVTMEAMESPTPVFCDNGSGTLDENGTCLLTLHPVFLQTAAVNAAPQWHVTASAPVTVHKNGLYAAVKGAPGTTFDWLCILPQKGREGTYARPADLPRAEYIHAEDHIAGERLAAVQNEVETLDRQVWEVSQQNDFIETVFAKEVAA